MYRTTSKGSACSGFSGNNNRMARSSHWISKYQHSDSNPKTALIVTILICEACVYKLNREQKLNKTYLLFKRELLCAAAPSCQGTDEAEPPWSSIYSVSQPTNLLEIFSSRIIRFTTLLFFPPTSYQFLTRKSSNGGHYSVYEQYVLGVV